jgi:hypothetical protein
VKATNHEVSLLFEKYRNVRFFLGNMGNILVWLKKKDISQRKHLSEKIIISDLTGRQS